MLAGGLALLAFVLSPVVHAHGAAFALLALVFSPLVFADGRPAAFFASVLLAPMGTNAPASTFAAFVLLSIVRASLVRPALITECLKLVVPTHDEVQLSHSNPASHSSSNSATRGR